MSASTTYSELTGSAQQRLAIALSRPELGAEGMAPEALRAASMAHRDLSAALAHLGRTLMLPIATAPTTQRRAARRRGPTGRVLMDLERRGRGRDWALPEPDPGTAARDVWEAARAIRAAADLWATHHSASGAPRTPESSRMRHPAVLGAATREWEALVATARDVADALLRAIGTDHHDQAQRVDSGADLTHLVSYPGTTARAMAAGSVVDVTVARPLPSRSGDALTLLAESVTRLRQAAWTLAESGQAPIPALANLAAVGAALSLAAAEAAETLVGAEGVGVPEPADRAHSGGSGRAAVRVGASDHPGAEALRRMHAAWAEAGEALADLRSPHPSTTILQVERLDVLALLRRVHTERRQVDSSDRTATGAGGSAADLAALARSYADVAGFNARGLGAAAARGDIYIRGEALPQHSLARRPDLLQAKLEKALVPAPTVVVMALEGSYRGVLRALDDHARDGTPAA